MTCKSNALTMIADLIVSHDIFCFPTDRVTLPGPDSSCNLPFSISSIRPKGTRKPKSSILSLLPAEIALHVLNLCHPRSLAHCASSSRQAAAILTGDPSNTARLFLAHLPTILSHYGHSRNGNRTSSTGAPMADYITCHATSLILSSPLVVDKLAKLAVRYNSQPASPSPFYPILQLIHGYSVKPLSQALPIHQLVRGPTDPSLASAMWPSRLVDLLFTLMSHSTSAPLVSRIVSTLAAHWPELLDADLDYWRTHPLLASLHLSRPPSPLVSSKNAPRPASPPALSMPRTTLAHLLALLAARQGHVELLNKLAPLVSSDSVPIAAYLFSGPWLMQWWCRDMQTESTMPVLAWAYDQVDPESVSVPFFLACLDGRDERVVESIFFAFDYPRLKLSGNPDLWAAVMDDLTDPCASIAPPPRVAMAIGRLLGHRRDQAYDLLLAVATSASPSAQGNLAWQAWAQERVEMICRGLPSQELRLKLFTLVYLHLLNGHDTTLATSSATLDPLTTLLTYLAPLALIHAADVLIATYPLADYGAMCGYFPYLRALGLDSRATVTYLLSELAAWWDGEALGPVVFALGLVADVQGDVVDVVEWLNGLRRANERVDEMLAQGRETVGRMGSRSEVRRVPLVRMSRVRMVLEYK